MGDRDSPLLRMGTDRQIEQGTAAAETVQLTPRVGGVSTRTTWGTAIGAGRWNETRGGEGLAAARRSAANPRAFSLTGATSAKRVGPASRTWSATGRDAGPVQASLEGVPAHLPCGNIEPPAINCFARPSPWRRFWWALAPAAAIIGHRQNVSDLGIGRPRAGVGNSLIMIQ